MELINENFYFVTEDKTLFTLDKRVKFFSKVFQHLFEDYEPISESKPYEMTNDFKKHVPLLINFVEALNYDHKIVNLKKPFSIYDLEETKSSLFQHINLKRFYDDFTSENIYDYAVVADFFDITQLEDIIFLRLYEVFQSPNSIFIFFQKEIKDPDKLIIRSEEMLKEKYLLYSDRYVKQLSDSEVDELLNKKFNYER